MKQDGTDDIQGDGAIAGNVERDPLYGELFHRMTLQTHPEIIGPCHELCQRQGKTPAPVYVIDSEEYDAYADCPGSRIFVTKPYIEKNPESILFVIEHEAGHLSKEVKLRALLLSGVCITPLAILWSARTNNYFIAPPTVHNIAVESLAGLWMMLSAKAIHNVTGRKWGEKAADKAAAHSVGPEITRKAADGFEQWMKEAPTHSSRNAFSNATQTLKEKGDALSSEERWKLHVTRMLSAVPAASESIGEKFDCHPPLKSRVARLRAMADEQERGDGGRDR